MNEVVTTVRARAAFIPLDHHGATEGGLDDGGAHVASFEVELGGLGVGAELFLGVECMVLGGG